MTTGFDQRSTTSREIDAASLGLIAVGGVCFALLVAVGIPRDRMIASTLALRGIHAAARVATCVDIIASGSQRAAGSADTPADTRAYACRILFTPAGGATISTTLAYDVARAFTAGSVIPVVYDPRHPELVALQSDIGPLRVFLRDSFNVFGLFVSGFVAVFGLVLLLLHRTVRRGLRHWAGDVLRP